MEAVEGTLVELDAPVDSLVLRTIAGDEYRVEAAHEAAASAPVAADVSLRTVTVPSGALIHAVAVLSDGRRIAANSDNGGSIGIWAIETGEQVNEWRAHSDVVMSLAALPDGRLASGSADRTVKVWEPSATDPMRTFEGHEHSVLAIGALPDGRRLVSGSVDTTLMVWDIGSGRAVQRLTGHREQVAALAPLPDGNHVLSASDDRTLRLWDLSTGATVRVFEGHGNQVWAVALLQDGRRAISASADGTLKLWDVASGEGLRTFSGHTHTVMKVAAMRDGSQFLSASGDGTLKIWEVSRAHPLRTLEGHRRRSHRWPCWTRAGRFPDRRHDSTLKLWDTTIQHQRWRPRHARMLETDWMDEACVQVETLGSQGTPATAFYVSPLQAVDGGGAVSRYSHPGNGAWPGHSPERRGCLQPCAAAQVDWRRRFHRAAGAEPPSHPAAYENGPSYHRWRASSR